ncbi:MAG: ABC transporter substrate-binding protein [Firmicutes bacterium]|nr:ABC transporter substrate-binding protein [Bacillota bacterium]
MKKLVFFFAILIITMCTACIPDKAVTPQPLERASLIFVAPQQGDFAIEGIPAAKIFMQRLEKASAELPYELDCLLIDESIGADRIVSTIEAYMTDNTVLGICGFWDADNAAKTAKLCKEKQIPLLLWAAVREDLTGEGSYPYVLRLCNTARAETGFLCKELIAKKGFSKWAVVCDNSSFGLANQESIRTTLQEQNCELSYSFSVDEASPTFNECISELKNSDAEIIIFGGKPELLNDFLTALYAAKAEIPIAAIAAASMEPELLPEKVFTVNYDFAQYNDFYTQFFLNQGFDCEMGIMTPLAYEAAGVFLSALKACGENPEGTLIAMTMAATEYQGMSGKVSFDSFGDNKDTSLLVIAYMQDKHWVILE